MKTFAFPAAIAGAVLLVSACGDEDINIGTQTDAGADSGAAGSGGSGGGAHDVPDSGDPGVIACAELGSVCHDFDTGSGDIGDQCHDLGHEGDGDACLARYDECIAFCQEHDEHDAGDGGDAEHDHGSEMCETLGSLCHGVDGGQAQECHDVGHAGDAHECEAVYDACLTLCGGHHDVDAGDAAHHGDGGD